MSSLAIEWWPSPAKINLFLHVCGQRPNGYHELQTLFQILDFGDSIGFQVLSTGNTEAPITLEDNIKGLAPQNNLIYKAAESLLPFRANKEECVCIHVRKRIPMGGGLGGGSTNAATVLLVLNKLWGCGLSNIELQKIGLTLGADVPVFVNGHTAFAEGVGENLKNTEVPTKYYLVATPKVHISTAEIFSHAELPRNTPKIDFSHYQFNKTKNDCEILVCNQHPEVANLLNRLLHYAPSRMTGTGASVFAVFNSEVEAQKQLSQLPKNLTAFVAKGVNVSPLCTMLDKLNV